MFRLRLTVGAYSYLFLVGFSVKRWVKSQSYISSPQPSLHTPKGEHSLPRGAWMANCAPRAGARAKAHRAMGSKCTRPCLPSRSTSDSFSRARAGSLPLCYASVHSIFIVHQSLAQTECHVKIAIHSVLSQNQIQKKKQLPPNQFYVSG